MLYLQNKHALAYIIGVALGDGNLSNPNKRAVRLRITCDLKYPLIIDEIIENLKIIAPQNKINIVKKRSKAVDVTCYSNGWEKTLGWNVGHKLKQKVRVPDWIKRDEEYIKSCLRGLLQTDGSIYFDRGYKMINFVNHGKQLAKDVFDMLESLGFRPRLSILKPMNGNKKYTVRIARDSEKCIKMLDLRKE